MSDTFRKEYVKLHEVNESLIKEIKLKAELLEDLFNRIGASRARSLARSNLEQSIMWATKAIVLFNEKGCSE